MSAPDANADVILSWNTASDILNRYFPIVIYVFGITGNVLNIFVLIQRPLRSNPSAIFFICSSIAGLLAIISGLTTRMMAGYATDMTTTVGWICKMRNFVLYSARTITLWSIALATIDRWLASSTNVSRRQTSSIRNARRSVVLVHIYACVINSPILYCYEANLSDALRGCYGLTYICRLITDLIYTIMTTLVPLLMMIIFGLLTIRHVRHTQNRIENITMVDMSYKNKNTLPTSTTRERSKKKVDKHLCKMLTVQVTLFVILTCPHGIQKSYSSIISSNEPSSQSLKNAVETFIFNLVTLLNFTASGIPFYIYTLAGGSLFRNTLFHLLKRTILKIFCR